MGDDVRRAELDVHAQSRFSRLSQRDVLTASARCRELFEIEALLKVLVAEVNSFSDRSLAESMPRVFLDWVSAHLTHKHVVFDEETCTRVEIDAALAPAILEALFLGQSAAPMDECYRGVQVRNLFGEPKEERSNM